MSKLVIDEKERKGLEELFKHDKRPELISTFLYFISQRDQIAPVAVPQKRLIFQSLEKAIAILEKNNELWRETSLKIGGHEAQVNEQTKRIYICPFTGKVFADNTHPNPQDAIYDWVSTCPENTERKNGLRVKRFFISEDPQVIHNYIEKRKEPIVKTVYSSGLTGALFSSKEAVIEDFKKHQVKPMSLQEILNQNRFQIEESFLAFIQKQLAEDNLTDFVEAMAKHQDFMPHVERWLEE